MRSRIIFYKRGSNVAFKRERRVYPFYGGISSGKMADMLAAADEPAESSPAAAGAS